MEKFIGLGLKKKSERKIPLQNNPLKMYFETNWHVAVRSA